MSIYQNLVFILYKKCNAQCSMCCFESKPDSKGALESERIKDYIIQSADIADITDISFTGGEPFLEYRKLVSLCALAKSCGKRVRTITNGYWASSYEKSLRYLSELQRNGVAKLTVSHDNYHKKYIATKNVNNVLRACNEIGLNCELSLVTIKGEKIGALIDDMSGALNNIPLNIIPCLPVGGAEKTFSLQDDFDRQIRPETTRCHYGSSMVVAWDGNIYPCCSQTVFNTVLSVGNFHHLSLHQAMSKLKNNAALYLLRNENMQALVSWARENTDISIPEKVVNVCELCQILFSSNNAVKLKEFINHRIDQRLEDQRNRQYAHQA